LNAYAISQTPNASTIDDVYNDTVIINEFDTSEYVYNKISGQWVRYPNGYLTTATNSHLGVVKGTQPPSDPTDESKDTFIQVLNDGQMKLIGNSVGKVNSVNNIEPDSSKNIKTDYIYETEQEYEDDKDNIPVNARIVKLWESPDNQNLDDDYSFDEKPVLGWNGKQKHWIDGRPIYKKTFQRTFSDTGAIDTVLEANGITDTIVNFEIVFRPNNNMFTVNGQLHYGSANTSNLVYIMQVTSNNNDIHVWRNINSSSYCNGTYTITVYYTKTTD
jgi:hypothetical protein